MHDENYQPCALRVSGKIEALWQMMRIRFFEQAALNCYNCGYMGGLLVLSMGQESVAVAVRMAMAEVDQSICGVRGLHHALASGLSMRAMMAELFGKSTGATSGKSGNFGMHHPEGRFWGIYPICAAQTPIAAGMAFQMKYKNTGGVAFCMLGEGSVNQGVFHETLNLASLFGLPVLFLIENNQYAMGTKVRRGAAFRDCIARRAEAYDMAWQHIENGYDLPALYTHIATAADLVRRSGKPFLLEVQTYRYYGFHVADANTKRYRTPEEIEMHKRERDPVNFLREQLLRERAITEELVEQMRNRFKAERADAVEYALASPQPSVEDVTKNVYWETDHQTAAAAHGVHIFST